jgi:PAS domain S-box-containing protein
MGVTEAWLDAIPAAIFVAQQQRVVVANRAAAALIGCAPADLIGASLDTLFDHIPAAEPSQGWLQPRAGSPILVDLTSQPVEHEGSPAYLITALRSQPQTSRYRAAIEGSADDFFLIQVARDSEGKISDLTIVDASESALQLTGLTRDQMIGHSARDLVPPNIAATLLTDFAERVAPGTIPIHEIYLYDHLVKTGWYQVQFIPLEDDQFAVFARDITERKESETVVQQLGTEIEQQARLLDEILGATPDGFILFDRAGRYLYVNRAGLENSGLTADQVIGKTWRELGFPEEVGLTFDQRLERVFTTGESITYEEQFPTTRGLRDFLTTQSPVHDKDGNVILLLNTIRDITERKQAEMEQQKLSAELEQQARVFDEVLSTTPDNFITFDRAGHFLYASPSALRSVNLTSAQVLGKTWSELGFPEEVGRHSDAMIARVFASGESTVIEEIFPTVRGLRDFESIFSPLHDKTGQVMAVVVTNRDITERKQMEEALRENQKLFASIYDTALVGIAVIDEQGYYVQANQTYGKIYGFSPSEMIGQNIRDIYSPNMLLAGAEASHERIVHGDVPISVSEWQVARADGQIIDIIAYNSVLVRESGERFRVAVSIDVTAQKHAQRALELSEQRLTSILNSMQDAVWSVQVETHQLFYANAAIEALTGYSAADFTGNQRLLIEIVHPDDRSRFTEQLSSVLEDDGIDTEYRIIRRDGETRWVHNRFWVVSGLEGDRIDGIMTDITDRKQAAEAAMQLAIERERVHILSEFVRDASHEFRTPLSIIHTRLYLMEKILDPQKHLEYIAGIKEQAERILTLVESLITMSRLDSVAKMHFERVNLNQLLGMMHATTREAAARKDLTFTLELAPEALYMQGEADELKVALNAIFDNAITYTPPGGRISVRSYRRDDDEIAVDVRDTGVGISSVEMGHIFERFYRVDQAHSKRGFGLGLPIARKIVDMHGGRIEVESQPEQGSVFRLIFPTVPAAAAVPQRAPARSSS